MGRNLKTIYILSVLFVIIDQFIKIFISSKMILNQSFILIKKLLSINLVHNTGAAFSILSGSRILLILIGILALVGVSLYIKRSDYLSDISILTYSLLIGGILGNLIDRIVYGYVIDYISFNIFGYNFPVFNIADICIVISIILIIVSIIREDLWNS